MFMSTTVITLKEAQVGLTQLGPRLGAKHHVGAEAACYTAVSSLPKLPGISSSPSI